MGDSDLLLPGQFGHREGKTFGHEDWVKAEPLAPLLLRRDLSMHYALEQIHVASSPDSDDRFKVGVSRKALQEPENSLDSEYFENVRGVDPWETIQRVYKEARIFDHRQACRERSARNLDLHDLFKGIELRFEQFRSSPGDAVSQRTEEEPSLGDFASIRGEEIDVLDLGQVMPLPNSVYAVL